MFLQISLPRWWSGCLPAVRNATLRPLAWVGCQNGQPAEVYSASGLLRVYILLEYHEPRPQGTAPIAYVIRGAHKRNDDLVVRPTLASQGVDKAPRARRGRAARLRYLRLVEYAREHHYSEKCRPSDQ